MARRLHYQLLFERQLYSFGRLYFLYPLLPHHLLPLPANRYLVCICMESTTVVFSCTVPSPQIIMPKSTTTASPPLLDVCTVLHILFFLFVQGDVHERFRVILQQLVFSFPPLCLIRGISQPNLVVSAMKKKRERGRERGRERIFFFFFFFFKTLFVSC